MTIADVYRLTPMQTGMFFHALADKESGAYFEQFLFSLKGEIDFNLLEKSFNALIERYDILRTIFHSDEKNQPLQIVLKQRKCKLDFHDIAHLTKEEQEGYIDDFMARDKKRGFDLTRDLLMRLALFGTGPCTYKLIWSFHHILMDGWCLGIIFKELSRFYYSYKTGESLTLPPVTPYVHYIKWLEKQDKEQGLRFWRRNLEGYEEQAHLGKFAKSGARQEVEYRVQTHTFKLTAEITASLNQIAAENSTTINMVLQTLWGILLQRYHHTGDVVFGAVVSGRPPEIPGIETMVGLFINTVPVRITSAAEKTVSQLVREVQQKAAYAKPYEYLPLAEIQAQSTLKNQLIDHIIVFENYPIERQVKDDEEAVADKEFKLKVEEVKAIEQTNYDFNILASPGKRLVITFNFNSSVFDTAFITQTALHLQNIIRQVAANPAILERDIEITTPEEKQRILVEFNDTEIEYPADKTIHQLFAAQAQRTPGSIALIGPKLQNTNPKLQGTKDKESGTLRAGLDAFDGMHLTYRELNEKSTQVARLLREKGVEPGTIVAIKAERSTETIIGILGILKTGAAYLPIDPGYPQERRNYMLADSAAKILLTSKEITTLSLNFSSSPLPLFPSSSLAYVIYTSGTTGKPRGVMIQHHSLVNFVYSMYRDYWQNFGTGDNCLSLTNFCFDVSVGEIFLPLLLGAGIFLLPYDRLFDPEDLARIMVKNAITFAYIPPGLLKNVFERLKQIATGTRLELNKMLVGVEPIKDEVLENFLVLNPGMQIVNGYGPTESTICATAFKYRSRQPGGNRVPIGSPLANTRILLLDNRCQPVPPGIPGELCISGAGLARGYLNNPELTAEKFCLRRPGGRFLKKLPRESSGPSRKNVLLFSPPVTRHPSTLYHTGDLAEWLPDGNIRFIGRIDQQVKIRGYRIELGEIESRLLTHEAVRDVVVMARETTAPGNQQDEQRYLCAYIAAAKEWSAAQLKEYLAGYLPGYMIPSFFISIEKVPLTANGKVDRKALPEPSLSAGPHIETPGDEIEEKLSDLWSEVLGTQGISITDNFFNLGGDSIKAIQIAARLQRFGLKLEIRDLFAQPTIKQLRQRIKHIKHIVDQSPVKGDVPLSPIQHWYVERNFNHPHHFNQAVMIQRQGGFVETIVKQVFQRLIEHHDALRMVLLKEKITRQRNRGIDTRTEGPLFTLETFDFKDRGEDESRKQISSTANRIQAGINLETGPLVKLGLFKTAQGDHLLIVIHHLVVDGVSWRILLEDLAEGYRQALKNEPPRFPPKTDSFQLWAQRLKEYAESDALLSELEYWQPIEETPRLPLPVDFEISALEKKLKNLRTLQLRLNPEETRQLLREANQAYTTEINDILLAALGLGFKDWAGIDRLLIHLEGHGREEILGNLDITRTVGWFTAQFPILLEMNGTGNLSYTIKQVKETLRRIPKKGVGYGILRYLTPGDKKPGFAPRQTPEISFNYLGELDYKGQNPQEEIFRMSDLKTGNQFSPENQQVSTIDINGMIAQSQLVLSFSYNQHQYKPATIEKLVASSKFNLQKIISHCVQKENREKTPSDLTYPHLTVERLETLTRQIGDIKDIYELSPMQAGMLFHAINDKESQAFFEQMVFSIQGEIHRDLLQTSLNLLVERYDILRTRFCYEPEDQPLQIVLRHEPAEIYFEEIGAPDEETQHRYLKEFCRRDRKKGFDPTRDPLLRISLLKTGNSSYKLVWSFHHILMDGWCTGIIFNEFSQIYDSLRTGEPLKLEPVTPYAEYIKWLKTRDKREGLEYWQEYLAGYEPPTGLMVPGAPGAGTQKISNTDNIKYEWAEYVFKLDESLTAALRKTAETIGVTINTVIQSTWGILLQKYHQTDDVVYGAVVSGRPPELEGVERMVGLFINTVPVRIQADNQKTFSQLAHQVQQNAASAKPHEYLSLAEIQALCSCKGELPDHIMVFENYPIEPLVKNENKTKKQKFIVREVKTFEQSNYHFNIILIPGKRLTVKFSFNSTRYDEDTVKKIADHFTGIMKQVTANPQILKEEIKDIPPLEKHRELKPGKETGKDKIEKKLLEIRAELAGVRETIGPHDNLLNLAGLSLNVTTLASAIYQKLQVRIPLLEIAKTPTIKALSRYIKGRAAETETGIEPAEEREYYAVSAAQKRLYILQQMESAHTGYNMPQIIPLEQGMDIPRLEQVFNRLIARHESLRTSFHLVDHQPVQRIHPRVTFKIEYENTGQEVDNVLRSFVRPFDLTRAPLLRVKVIGALQPGVRLFIDMHHIITDGTSQAVLRDEILRCYDRLRLPPLKLRCKDYAQWQYHQENRVWLEAQEAYWLEVFTGELPVLNLPTDFPRPVTRDFEGNTVPFLFSAAETRRLKELAKTANLTLFMVVMAAFNLLLAKLSSQEDIIVATPTAGRRQAHLERLIGMFVNTLPLRNWPAGDKTLKDFLQGINVSTLGAFTNQDYPLEKLVEQLAPQRDPGRNPLFDVMLNLLNQGEYDPQSPGPRTEHLNRHQKSISKFDLTLSVMEMGGNLVCSFEYYTKIFQPGTIDRLIVYFKKAAEFLTGNPGQRLSQLELLSPTEKQQILLEFNDTASPYPRDKTIHLEFALQAAQTPDRIVVIGTGHRTTDRSLTLVQRGTTEKGTSTCVRSFTHPQHISYRQVDRESLHLARTLAVKGVKPGSIAAIMIDTSLEMVSGILGILKAGGAYLPIPPEYPPDRIDFMLKDSKAEILLTSGEIASLSTGHPAAPQALKNCPKGTTSHLHLSPAPATSLAYIIYTSGSTGSPKGVMVNHQSVLRLVKNTNFITFSPSARLLQTGALNFDASTFETWGSLLNGLTLCLIAKDDLVNPLQLKTAIRQWGVTLMWMTSPLFNRMVQADIEIFQGLKTLLVGGDVLSPPHIRQVKEAHPRLNIINGYGPTENTTFSTTHPVELPIKDNIPIGKPIANSTAYILDRYGHLLPVGVPGELAVGGDGLARGYMNNPELTAQKFCLRRPGGRFLKKLPPWTPRKNFFLNQSPITNHQSPIYLTGDLARWLPDGTIEFLGRRDFQVKIRGFRIEPGEIQHRLLHHHQVKEAVVVARCQDPAGENETGEKYLCAYIVPTTAQEPGPENLRRYLAAQLPDYMIPAYFVPLRQIPLNPNGKVDLKALPEPGAKPGDRYTAPKNEVEQQLVTLWAEVLGRRPDIGIHDNFFALGGHSLKATVLIAKIYQVFHVKITLKDIFATPTISEIATRIAAAKKVELTNPEKLREQEFYELSFQQKRLWVLQQLDPQSPAYHMPGYLVLDHEVDEEAVKKALRQVVMRHESLRTGFKLYNDEPRQFILKDVDPPLEFFDFTNLAEDKQQAEKKRIFRQIAVKTFQFDRPPLFRSALVKSAPRHYEFMFNIHHITCDGWSMEILKQDFYHAYEAYSQGKEPQLPPLDLQYKEFAAMHNKQLQDPVLKKEAHNFWKKKLSGTIPPLTFHGTLKGDTGNKSGAAYQCVIDNRLKEKLKKAAEENNTSLFMFMFSVYLLFLHRFSGQQDIACSIISADRDHAALHRVIGFFINSLMVKIPVNQRESFKAFLQRVTAEILGIFEYQSYPPELVFEELHTRYPDIPVSFNMLNLQDTTSGLELPSTQSLHIKETQEVKFHLEPYVTEYKNGILCYWAYKKDLFLPSAIEYMAGEYIKLLDYFSTHLETSYEMSRHKGEKPMFKRKKGG